MNDFAVYWGKLINLINFVSIEMYKCDLLTLGSS
jgi:hypothetical protein